MTSNLIKASARIFGGSAVAGMGFSLGRDIYKKVKKPGTKNTIIALIVLAAAVIGTYTGGVWLARNYETIWGSVFKRVGGVIILVPSFVQCWRDLLRIFQLLALLRTFQLLALAVPYVLSTYYRIDAPQSKFDERQI